MKHLFSCVALTLAALTFCAAATAQEKTAGKEIGIAVQTSRMQAALSSGTTIFFEGFNDTALTSPFPPAGWTTINADTNGGADTSWYQSLAIGGTVDPGPFEGVAFAADYYGTANAKDYIDDYLITPNTGGTAPAGAVDSLIFYVASRLSSSGDYPDSLDIRVSTTDTKAASFTQRLDYILAPKGVWTRFAYALPMATNRFIAFRYLLYDGGKNGDNSDKVCLDAVQIVRYATSAVKNLPGPVPAEFALRQNYPNPFNPGTTIEFHLSTAANTSLTVLNDAGAVVATLLKGNLAPGRYTAYFDGSRLASGVYFYRLVSGTFVDTKRMVILK